MANWAEEVFAPIEAVYKANVMAQTFGHLAPKPKNIYSGWALFTLTAFGDTCIIDFEFNNLDASPWFNEDILDYIGAFTDTIPKNKNFGVYKFSGTYQKYKNAKFKFKGCIDEINCLTQSGESL